ncbi:hypothetical protein ACFUKV_36800 [Streptomyces paradoxus]|uniref:hypothetical protein n=1 Tax=Streptomyces paradoxus TaxID=66375 RepID=UPI00362D518F
MPVQATTGPQAETLIDGLDAERGDADALPRDLILDASLPTALVRGGSRDEPSP